VLRDKLVYVVVVTVVYAGDALLLSAPACPLAIACPTLGEARDLDATGEQTLAEASNLPCSCDANPQYPDRITDCIRRAPESLLGLTICELCARLRRLAFGVTDGARTRDLL
jgi:hypothetical protein